MTTGPSAPACSRDERSCVVAPPERDDREARVFLTKRKKAPFCFLWLLGYLLLSFEAMTMRTEADFSSTDHSRSSPDAD